MSKVEGNEQAPMQPRQEGWSGSDAVDLIVLEKQMCMEHPNNGADHRNFSARAFVPGTPSRRGVPRSAVGRGSAPRTGFRAFHGGGSAPLGHRGVADGLAAGVVVCPRLRGRLPDATLPFAMR